MPLGLRPFRTIATLVGRDYDASVRAYALVEIGDSEAIDLFLREADAERALADVLSDEPGWAGTLTVEPIELDERAVSTN